MQLEEDLAIINLIITYSTDFNSRYSMETIYYYSTQQIFNLLHFQFQ